MKQVLLIMTPGRQSTEALHWCLHHVKEKNKTLKVIYVVDEGMTLQLEESIAETGFIGDKPGEELKESLDKEYFERGKKILEQVEKQARTFQAPCKTELKRGSYLDICEKEAGEELVDILVVTEKKEGFFKKLFEGTESHQLKGRVCCEIKVYQS